MKAAVRRARMRERFCAHCDKLLPAESRSSRKFCGDACQKAAARHAATAPACQVCGGPLPVDSTARRRNCSDACKQRAARAVTRTAARLDSVTNSGPPVSPVGLDDSYAYRPAQGRVSATVRTLCGSCPTVFEKARSTGEPGTDTYRGMCPTLQCPECLRAGRERWAVA